MATKTIQSIVAPINFHWVGDGFRVFNYIPGNLQNGMQSMNPFILLDYGAKFQVPPSDTPRGVGVHPHRGFETVTIAYKGKVEHHDSSGGGGVIGEGDVQWMTAASGVLHKEFHESQWSKKGGEFQMVQLWVNLPAKFKMSEPKYQAIKNSDMGKYLLDDGNGTIEVIAGEYCGVKGPASTFTPINLFNVKLNKNGKAEFDLNKDFNTALVVIEGSIRINNSEVITQDYFVHFSNDGEKFTIEANENSIILIMSGEPINETIVAGGPFVMNTKTELLQAFDDFRSGKFGYLED